MVSNESVIYSAVLIRAGDKLKVRSKKLKAMLRLAQQTKTKICMLY